MHDFRSIRVSAASAMHGTASEAALRTSKSSASTSTRATAQVVITHTPYSSQGAEIYPVVTVSALASHVAREPNARPS